jgi:hypothetical protein
MLRIFLLIPLAAAAQTVPAPAGGVFPLNERAKMYAGNAVGPLAWLAGGAAAGINQWRDSNPEWGQGMTGYGKRLGDHMAGTAISSTIEFGLSAALREDTRHYPEAPRGVLRRALGAAAHTFVVPRENGGRTVSWSRIGANYGTAFLSNAWYPDRLRDPGHTILRGSYGLAGSVGSNVFREFWPDIRRRLFRRGP